MATTAERVLAAMSLKQDSTGEWRGPNPWRAGSDGTAFSVKVDSDGEHGTYYDHKSQEQGSLYDLAEKLGIDTPNGRAQVENSKREYSGLADYAALHGVEAQTFTNAGWSDVEYQGRPAIAIPTDSGTRYRFLDNQEPRYRSPMAYKRCWYGLNRAVPMAKQAALPLVLCNGEASTVVAQSYGVPAFAVAGGSERAIPDELLQSLLDAWPGQLIIALDCDEAGRNAATKIRQQLPNAQAIDLMLGQGGDLADFCKLHSKDSTQALLDLSAKQKPKEVTSPWSTIKPITLADTASNMIARLDEDNVTPGAILSIPFRTLHSCGGLARRISARKLIGIIAASGGGKTSFLETLTDMWNMRGEYGFYDGPEWSADEYMDRRVVRYSQDKKLNGKDHATVTFDDLSAYELWKKEAKRGIPQESREGRLLTEAQENSVQEIAIKVRKWRGGLEYIPDDAMFLEDKLDYLSYRIAELNKQGIEPSFAIWDYVQLYNVRNQPSSNGDNIFQYALWLIKKWSERENMVSVFASQINKDASKIGRKDGIITPEMARYVRSDYANLFLSLNLVRKPDSTAQVSDDGDPPMLRVMDKNTGYFLGRVYVGKNSGGTEGVIINMYADLPRFRWVDQRWYEENVQIALHKPDGAEVGHLNDWDEDDTAPPPPNTLSLADL